MPLIQLVIVLIVVGVLLWLVQTVIPMDARIKQIITALVIVCVVLWLLSLFLGYGWDSGPYIGHRYR
jgi:low temperature requirement protein LtrA